MTWIWLGVAVVCLGIELFTSELVAIWFSCAAFVLTIVSAIFSDLVIGWQIVIFVVLSAILVAATRPLVKKLTAKNKSKETNLDLVLHHKALVTDSIDNDLEQGAVKINGLVWTARSENGDRIDKDVLVQVQAINGNKLIVKRIEKEEK